MRRARRIHRIDATAATLAVLAGVTILAIASVLFAYHSSNHDEGVYLFQAAMLLEGQLELHAGDLAEVFRPWFFVEEGGRLYPRYAPVPAAMYAASMAVVGEPRLSLAVIMAANVALVYTLGATVFDRRVGIVGAAIFAASPLALISSSVFLPYAPTTTMNLAFAVAYLRGIRDGSHAMAALAGLAIGLAFFSRPYTAILFAIPFIVHAAYRSLDAVRDRPRRAAVTTLGHHGLTALVGLAFVGIALGYNLQLTGDPLQFPYQTFAPLDGPGFGRRAILGHAVDYTPVLAIRSTAYVLWYFATRWFTAGVIGTSATLAGIVLVARSHRRRWRQGEPNAGHQMTTIGSLLLCGVILSVVVGNVAFWGNVNILATPTDPTDGLLGQFGPFYHFDLLVPMAIFAGIATVAAAEWLGRALETVPTPRVDRRTILVGAIVLLVVGGLNLALLAGPVERHAAHAAGYEVAYEPFETTDLDDSVVLLPTPYGPWQHHPFQYLRNDPDLDGQVVYALDLGPDSTFDVRDAYPTRQLYRFTYRGRWPSTDSDPVEPRLEPLEHRRATAVEIRTGVGVPDHVTHATVRLEASSGSSRSYLVDDPPDEIDVAVTIDHTGAVLEDPSTRGEPLDLDATDELVLTVTLVQPDGSTLTYRGELDVRTGDEAVELLWPPRRFVCPLVTDCGTEGTYLPDRSSAIDPAINFDIAVKAAS